MQLAVSFMIGVTGMPAHLCVYPIPFIMHCRLAMQARGYLDDQGLLDPIAHGAKCPIAEGVNGGQQHRLDRGRNSHVQLRALRLGGGVDRCGRVKG